SPLSDDIEGRAEPHAHPLVLRCMVDDILADQLQRAIAGVELRDAKSARRQRHAHPKVAAVLELEVDVDLRVHRQAVVGLHDRPWTRAVESSDWCVHQPLSGGCALYGLDELDLHGRVILEGNGT